ncbi:HEAT repeat domain-containing protein [Pseudoalteromonas luteoviolacea]|uniref:HEAT repeat domain-containing protein n=1 Tax=Pseudoalteromonas luteoviolacea S4054 TaxID=1129367 RepID=A0A0F6A6I7_9GAMM|nr:HEAT repeat domain-containing protein [Pseudoalteromonas luteoviolacea]AOT08902.1 hypothetical protein S4054249_13995 [Pseudoalteromonas luteoviolacea]AOT13815.1 hypothetical protein S40542_13965 [Pseudoalteromonas luteoviolacea]AOT18729.1 hypothetical protein S4054_13970 [Pseudoalteromonas luteoviolacea]KKE81738.1 hypothetical protein N479_21145 [Pseudoalteromonas luteoviolacea S4054]KZN68028.1 hypothetical protein N481_23595 [Pseudoalteromonas luteoviolacea S4047-1]
MHQSNRSWGKYSILLIIFVLLLVFCFLFFGSPSKKNEIEPTQDTDSTIDELSHEVESTIIEEQVVHIDLQKGYSDGHVTVKEEVTSSEKLEGTLQQLKLSIEQSNESLHHAIMGPSNTHIVFRSHLLMLLEEDPSLVTELIDVFIGEPNSLLGRELSAVLSESGHPLAQAAALDLALDLSIEEAQRAAGLLLVAKMKEVTGETRDRILAHIDSEGDLGSDMQQFAIMALKPAPSSEEDYQRVQSTLSIVVQAEDHNIRRHGVYQMAQWATNNQDLQQVRELALNDPDVNTRARAVMSLGDSAFKSEENRSVLWQVADDANEPPPVRLYALKSLSRYTLNDNEMNKLRAMQSSLKDRERTNSNLYN